MAVVILKDQMLTFRVQPASQDEDRVYASYKNGRLILVLADGAGGCSGGREAADLIIKEVRDLEARGIPRSFRPAEYLSELDIRLHQSRAAGLSTGIVVVISEEGIVGASVGDSEAWLVQGSVVELTANQCRKPLLGSGTAVPVGFSSQELFGRLLVSSDGLVKYAKRNEIADLVNGSALSDAVDQLINLARLPSGGLQDDISVILVDFKELLQHHKEYIKSASIQG